MRIILTHEYFRVDAAVVWTTVHHHLPLLKAQFQVARGMTACVEKVQGPEFAARDRRYAFVSQQQEVGTDIPEAEKLTDRACRVEFALAEHGL